MSSGENASATRFGFVAAERPDFAEAFSNFFRASYNPAEPVLDKKVRILIYLALLASQGAEHAFRAHLRDAAEEGISQAEILEAMLIAIPAVGYTPVMNTVGALTEYP